MVRLLGLIGMLPEVDPSTWDHREVRIFLFYLFFVLKPDYSQGRTHSDFAVLFSW